MKFKVGDLVKYVSGNWGDATNNPLWGGKYGKIVGKVTDIRDYSLSIFVDWSTGKINSYDAVDLEFYCKKKSKVNCFKCKDRLKCLTRGII